jgi:hypothetical protein
MSVDAASRRDVLFARMEVLSWRLQQGEDLDPARLLATTSEAMELAPELSIEDRQRLMDRLIRAQAAVREAQEHIVNRIAALPSERRAIRGYVSHNSPRPVTGRVSRRA